MTNNIFWIDTKHDVKKSYNDLLNDINEASVAYPYIKQEETYNMFLYLLINIIHDIDTIIIDHDVKEKELELLNINQENINKVILLDSKITFTFKDIFFLFKGSKSKWQLSLFTSGTTGTPKKINHDIKNLIRNVRLSEKYTSNIWGFAYNATHYAGLQVFFQAFMNKNPMINIFDIKIIDIEQLLFDYKITNISATPTYYRSLSPMLTKKNKNVQHITLGGEKFDGDIQKTLACFFVNTKFHNIYASTEAGSLLNSNGESFSIPHQLKTKIKISESNELLIHYSLLGKSNAIKVEADWYNSGDIIEKINEDNFLIKGRKSDIINVGGYNVSPSEVENLIRKNKSVFDVLVRGRSNKLTGNIIVADVVRKDDTPELELKNQILLDLNNNLQNYKIPRIFTFVDEIKKSRTGKIIRK
jgi:acyl-coenzyme A synthetase/AMP-(fatty) acid ligase